MNPAPPVTSIFLFLSCVMKITIKLYSFVGVNRVYVAGECYKDFSGFAFFPYDYSVG